MTYMALAIAFGACVSQWPSPAHAEFGTVGCTGLKELNEFVSQSTEYAMLGRCPVVRVANKKTLALLQNPKAAAAGEQALAMYLPNKDEIVLSSELDRTGVIGRSYLVHELVHAHQFASGDAAQAPCAGWLEGEAYRVQADFLTTNGMEEVALTFKIMGLLQSSCAQGYGPEY